MPITDVDVEQRVESLSNLLIDEVFRTLGLNASGTLRKAGGRLFHRATRPLAKLGVEMDRRIAESTVNEAFAWAVGTVSNPLQVSGVENVPIEGPVLLIANHPGTIDSLAIIASAPRPDIKAIAGLDPVIYAIENLRDHLIFVTSDTHVRMLVMRQGIRHLQNGGCMLFFPAGHIEPDPAVFPGAADSIRDWHRSVEIFLKRVPETTLVPVAISHILLPRFVRHIFARLRRNPSDWQRTAEMLQILSQMVSPGKHKLSPRITFGAPISYAELVAAETPSPTEHLQETMLDLLARHVAAFNEPHPPLQLKIA